MISTCPVCFFDAMPYPPEDYNICPCCGTEFGNDDVEYSYDELRYAWIRNGAHWFFDQSPANWSAWAQLARASFGVHAEGVVSPNTVKIPSDDILEYSVA